jgi:hypothetical protein
MPDYFVFGGCLRSELEFPELAPAAAFAPSWCLTLGTVGDGDGEEVIADTRLSKNCRMRVTRSGDVVRYEHSCAGRFEIGANGRDIRFEPAPGADMNVARTDLVARVLMLAVDDRLVLWLHGSAVAIGGEAVGFLGASGVGKSTFALALAATGRVRHICDDTLPVDVSDVPHVWASDHTLRLRDDSRELLAASARGVRRDSDGKHVVTHDALAGFHGARSTTDSGERFPLRALYLLRPVESAGGSAHPTVRRKLLAPLLAVTALMPQTKLGPVVRDGAPERMLRQLSTLASRIPVYQLAVPRAMSMLDEVTGQFLSWHQAGDAAAARCAAAGAPG